MTTSLSINKKVKYFITSSLVVLLSTLYLYNEYKSHNDIINQNIEKEMYLYYQLYLKTFIDLSNQKNIVIEQNDIYTLKDDLINEFEKSTPLMMKRENKKPSKYTLTIKYIEKNPFINNDYKINFNHNTITLIGKVSNNAHIIITRSFDNLQQLNETIEQLFIKILFIGIFNIALLFYLIHLAKMHEQTKKELHNDFEQLQIDTKKVAFEDTLTGAATRLKFDETLKDLVNIASRFKEQKFTAIMIDIDNFKIVNDTYGHDYGDIVLKQVAKVVQKHIRKTDTFARWGGEEFVILSPMTSLRDSNILSNKIRTQIANTNFEKLDFITCSFGLAEFRQDDTELSIMKRADQLLYKAKQNGKNRVEYL